MEQLEVCYRMCDAITAAEVSDAANRNLRSMLRLDLVNYCIYLAYADGVMSRGEELFIRETFDYPLDWSSRSEVLDRISRESGFAKKAPNTIKYFILADAGRRVKNDPWKHKKTSHLVQIYDDLGKAMAAVDQTKATQDAAAAYVKMLDKFMEGYGLFRNKNVRISGGRPAQPTQSTGAQLGGKSGETKPAQTAAEAEKPAEPVRTEELTAERIDAIMSELNSLVGLKTVKEEIYRLVDLLRVQQMRKEQGLSNRGTSRHMVFYGNPGTGKTTVARLLADIYRELGLLPTGQLVEVDRSGLVGGYVGQTAIKTSEVIEQAVGGVLFIDEAYTLTANKGQNDFGQEAVDTILKAMEDYRDEMVVIVAGYTELMKEFLHTNPGLMSRFNYFIEFPDYTPEELVAILELQCKKNEYKLSDEAREKALALFTDRCNNKPENFANAREVRNFMENAMLNHASRVTKLPAKKRTKEVLARLEAEDLGHL